MEQVYKEGDQWVYNQYNPPFWQADQFYSQGKVLVTKQNSIPKLYRDFIMHLVNGDEKSFNYIIDWLANAIHE